MNFFLRLLGYILFLNLCACVSQQKIQVLSPCQLMCVQAFEICTQQCTNNCLNCLLSTRCKAKKSYLKYVHEKQIQGGTIMRGLNSYRDPLQCRKVTCNCRADLMLCRQGCTGVIHKRLQQVPKCS